MKTTILIFLLTFFVSGAAVISNGTPYQTTEIVQDTTTVAYWKLKAKVLTREALEQRKLAEKSVAEKLEMKKKLDECMSKK